jgi:3-oxoacyl-[acyl-carrier protein] reductase
VSLAIVGGGEDLSRALATEFHAQGEPVVTIGDGLASPTHFPCDLAAAADIESCLTAAASHLGDPAAVIRLGIRPSQAVPTEVAALSLGEWTARGEVPLHQALAFHQAAQRFLADRGGRIIVVIPTVGLSGGPGYAPLAATAEADRTLVKAQARVSAQHGVTINCVAVASALLAGSEDDPDRSGLPPYALPVPDLAAVAAVILGLLGSAFDTVTGQTIAVDGGRWMAP